MVSFFRVQVISKFLHTRFHFAVMKYGVQNARCDEVRRIWGYLRTGDVLDQLCYWGVVSQWAPCCLHMRQLRHKLLYFSHCFGIMAFLWEKTNKNITSLAERTRLIVQLRKSIQMMTPIYLITQGQSYNTSVNEIRWKTGMGTTIKEVPKIRMGSFCSFI